jgi:hypothetical protein
MNSLSSDSNAFKPNLERESANELTPVTLNQNNIVTGLEEQLT